MPGADVLSSEVATALVQRMEGDGDEPATSMSSSSSGSSLSSTEGIAALDSMADLRVALPSRKAGNVRRDGLPQSRRV